jgi:hypothetical protein
MESFMTRANPIGLTIPALLLLLTQAPGSVAGEGHGDADFVGHMSRMQYFTHKLGLSVSAQNRALQGYYVHEVEEIIEAVAEVDQYKGIEVGRLIKTILEPAFEDMERAVEQGSVAQVDGAYEGLLKACNTCHQAADHGFIRIERRRDNPYMQSFSPAEE